MLLLEPSFADSLPRLGYSVSVDVGTQILAAVIVGLLVAFALQLLLTSLGLAIGVTALGFRVASVDDAESEDLPEDLEEQDPKKSSTAQRGSTLSRMSLAAGLGILATIDSVLFAASFLAVKVTQVGDPVSGALVGLVIWSAYFLILLWLSSIAIGSIAGSILDLATVGVRRLVSAMGSVFAPSKDHLQTENLPIKGSLTKEAAIALIQQETALSLANIRPVMEDYLKAIAPPQLDRAALQQDLLALVQGLERPTGNLDSGDRLRLIDLIQQRTGFSQPDAEQVVGQLESFWQESGSSIAQRQPSAQKELASELLSFLRSANPEELELDPFSTQLEQSFQENPDRVSRLFGLLNLPQPDFKQIDFKQVLQTALSQIDFSELDFSDLPDLPIEEVWQQLQTLQRRFQGKPETIAADPDWVASHQTDSRSPAIDSAASEPIAHLQQKLESYLRYTNPQKLTPEQVERKLSQLLEEVKGEKTKVALPDFAPADWAALLDRRKSLTRSQRQRIIAKLEEVWHAGSDRALSPPQQAAKPLQVSRPKTLQIPESPPESPREPAALENLFSKNLFSKINDYFDSRYPALLDDQNIQQKIQHTLDRLLEKFSLPGFDPLQLDQWLQSALSQGLSKASPLSAIKKALKAPQAAMQGLPDRLDRWSHELFTQLLTELTEGFPQSRQAIAEALPDALPEPFLIQAAALRDRLLYQIEQLQQEAQQQVDQLRQQAQQRIEETRKIAAIAAWWLFFTAFSAACSAAIAGALGVEFLKIK
jgi:hypothetical protein